MSKQYSPKRFFRQVPNCLLKQYFDSRGVLTEIGFSDLAAMVSKIDNQKLKELLENHFYSMQTCEKITK